MNAVISFEFDSLPVRGLNIGGEPWFVAKDLAEVLGYTNSRKAVADHCKCSRPVGSNELLPPLDPQTIIIPERDMYRLIMRSKLPAAERIEEWVVGEVLPTIRKTGGYGHSQAAPGDQILVSCDIVSRHIALLEEKAVQAGRRRLQDQLAEYQVLVRSLIEASSLSNEDIAKTLEKLTGSYMPEWVAWQRRLTNAEATA
ncbi:Bro-N domain-containing protein [Rhodospirillum sp. A1_3_36]|uniref:BRO-N domain-containing protein n=1 Tax=Rhodospirillum sp. A1_3_36 TaxID=3391666 RepID=UPI0039A40E88